MAHERAGFERGFVAFVAAAGLFMAAVLLADSEGLAMQLGLGAATTAFVWFFGRRSGIEPRQIVAAICVATAGEIVLSLGWGLYTYAHALIPLYVPPGHGLFYLLAAASARQRPLQMYGERIVFFVLVAGTLNAAVSLFLFGDVWGVLWWAGAVALILRSKHRLMLATCFVYTMLLEWAGTFNGNWRWEPVVPFLGLRSANPPAGVGILYILLDLIAVWLVAYLARGAAPEIAHPDVDRADQIPPYEPPVSTPGPVPEPGF